MEDPTAVTAIEPIGKHALVDHKERRLQRKMRWSVARLGFSFIACMIAIDVAIMNPLPWFVVQSVLLFGYAVVNGIRFDKRMRELDDYRIERTAHAMFARREAALKEIE